MNRSDGVSDKSKRRLVIVATAAAFLLFFLMVLAGELSRRFEPLIDFAAIETGTTDEGYPYLGSANAPVRIAKYSDYLCYYCRGFIIEVEPQIVEEYIATGKVRLESRYYASGNAQLYLTSAAHCAADQER